MSALIRRIDAAISWLVILTLGLSPLFFLPVTQNYYDTNKWTLLVISGAVVFLLWAVKSALTKTIQISISRMGVAFLVLTIVALASLAFISSNKVEAALSPLGVGLFAYVAAILFFGVSAIGEQHKKILQWLLLTSAMLLGLMVIYQYIGIGKTMFPKIEFLADPLWTPAGSPAGLLAVLLLSLPLALATAVAGFKKKHEFLAASVAVIFLLVITGGLVLSIMQIIPKWTQSFMPFAPAWIIMLEVLKNPRLAILGIGAENFLPAFTMGRTVSMNLTPEWNMRFMTSASLLFQVTTTLGIAGLAAMFFVLKALWKTHMKRIEEYALPVCILLIIVLPPTIPLILGIATVALLLSQEKDNTVTSWHIPQALGWLGTGLLLTAVVATVLVGIRVGRAYAAEIVFFRSLVAAHNNDGKTTYELQTKATSLNPSVSRFHLTYSQTNLAIANTLSANTPATASAEKKTTADQDRQNISTLIQQAIREAKIAINLAPQNIMAWENLAQIYQSMIAVASGSDQWAVAAYSQAVQLDPTNHFHRINLAQLALRQGDVDGAIQYFLIAANLKPDWPNTYYNLAYAYKLKKDNLRSALALQQTLDLLPSDSKDRERVQSELVQAKQILTKDELATFDKAMQGSQSQPESSLSRPDQQPTPKAQPSIALPQEAAPPTK